MTHPRIDPVLCNANVQQTKPSHNLPNIPAKRVNKAQELELMCSFCFGLLVTGPRAALATNVHSSGSGYTVGHLAIVSF